MPPKPNFKRYKQQQKHHYADIIMGFYQGRGGGGCTPLYLPYRYVPLQRGMDFAYFGLNLGKIFKGIQE